MGEREGSNIQHLPKSRPVDRSAWAQKAESIETMVAVTPRVGLLRWGTGCLCVAYSLILSFVLDSGALIFLKACEHGSKIL